MGGKKKERCNRLCVFKAHSGCSGQKVGWGGNEVRAREPSTVGSQGEC